MQAQPQGSSLRDLVRQGYVAPIWCNGREILRRLFVTVRDRQWREVAPTRFEYAIDEAAGTVSFNARHANEEVDFEWRGLLQIADNFRKVRFAVEGKALRDMEVCRVGLVVLHPVDTMVDSQLSVLSPQGDQRITVPRLISPQPIVNGIPQAITEPFSGLVVERSDFGKLELRFSGELFEIEDQRNWGDTSFKTYCRPLRLGYPRKVEAGALITHTLEARFVPSTERPRLSAPKQGDVRGTVFPRIKRELPLLEVDKSAETALRNLLASPSSMKVELRIEPGTDREFPLDLVDLLSRLGDQVERLLIYGPGTSVPCRQAIESLRQKIESAGALNFPLLAATRGHFVEFNRGVKFDVPVAGIAFPFTATVHSDDPETITENAAALVDIAETARHLTGASEIVISPLALYHPPAVSSLRFPNTLVRPWLIATLVHAALAGVDSITLAADLLHALDSSGDGIISDLLAFAGCEVAPVGEALPAGVHAMAVLPKGSEPARMLVANLGSELRRLMLDAREVQVPSYGSMWIELAG